LNLKHHLYRYHMNSSSAFIIVFQPLSEQGMIHKEIFQSTTLALISFNFLPLLYFKDEQPFLYSAKVYDYFYLSWLGNIGLCYSFNKAVFS